MDQELDESVKAFVQEARELLEEMEAILLHLEQEPDDAEQLNSLFRTVHTIKGTAGLFGFKQVVSFTHTCESVMDKIRAGQLSLNEDISSRLLSSRDVIEKLVEAATQSEEADELTTSSATELTHHFNFLLGIENPDSDNPDEDQSLEQDARVWNIQVTMGTDAFRNGQEPLSVINYLSSLGENLGVNTSFPVMPQWDEFDPENCHLSFTMLLRSSEPKSAIIEAFEFLEDDCEVSLSLAQDNDQATKLMEQAVDSNIRLGSVLVASGAVTEDELANALTLQEEEPAILGDILVKQGAADQDTVNAAVATQKRTKSATVDSKSARVAVRKLEGLTDLVGELVIAGASTTMLAKETAEVALISSMENMSRLIEEIRDTALGLRMVQISGTFNKYRRVVRDICQQLGKNVELEITGAETELDRAVVEKLADPLMHLVRNAIDHGIEPTEERIASGKSGTGKLGLHAYHDSGHIVIEVVDDGRGLNKQRILEKAIERGLIGSEHGLSDQDIYKLIFEPGFSTATEVTDISGRGVGMDVVRQNIEAVRGHIDITSEPGRGSTLSIRLPLTLAIIDGFLVKIGASFYVIPLNVIEECTEMLISQADTDVPAGCIELHGEVFPTINLAERFSEKPVPGQRENVVVAQFAGHKVGLVVNELLGEYQTVIKPLGKIFKRLSAISGATILGTGAVALILDVPALITQVSHQREMLAETH